jgi:hypothetical protein
MSDGPTEPPAAGITVAVDGSTLIFPKLAVTLDEAAELLSVSRDYFDEHVRPHLALVRQGRRLLVPVQSLVTWIARNAESII